MRKVKEKEKVPYIYLDKLITWIHVTWQNLAHYLRYWDIVNDLVMSAWTLHEFKSYKSLGS